MNKRAWPIPAIVALAGVAGGLAASLPPHASALTSGAAWSEQGVAPGCGGVEGLFVVFPSERPDRGSGEGAIVWGEDGAAAAATACADGMWIARVDARDRVAAPTRLSTSGRVRGLAATWSVVGAPGGKILILGVDSGHEAGRSAGAAGGAFSAPQPLAEGPAGEGGGAGRSEVAASTAYLGDAALVSVDGGGRMWLRMWRHYERRLGGPRLIATGVGGVGAIAVGLDFRSDAVVAWQRGSAIFALEAKAHGAVGPIERVGPAPGRARIAVLDSDDERASVVWSATWAGSTSVYGSVSAMGVRFGRARLLERFADLGADPPGEGAVALIRLAKESVMCAWTGRNGGRYVVRVATVSHSGVRRPTTISGAGESSEVAAFAPGPANEALAVWRSTSGTAGRVPQALFAARGDIRAPGIPRFGSPERVGGGRDVGAAAAAFDPDTDRALVAWSQGDQVHWAVRSPGAIPGRGLGGGGSGGAALGAAIVVAVAVGGVGTAAWRRRRRSALLDRGPGLM